MKSVSIVYRKHTHQQSAREVPHSHSLVKRSVDQYYVKLVEKEKNKDKINVEKHELLQRVKLQTSKSQRNSDQYGVLGSLCIAQISLKQQQEKRQEIKLRDKDKAIILRKLDGVKTVLKGLNLPYIVGPFDEEDGEERSGHCKLKNLYINKGNDVKDTIIAVSAKFIINQHYFWGDQNIQDSCAKYWKILQSYSTIAWICEKEDTCKKIIKFCRLNNLRLDSVYQIIPRKNNKNLTVSYYLIESDYNIRFHKSNSPLLSKDERKMIAINAIEAEHMKQIDFRIFYQNIPIIRNYRSVVHYIRMDMNDRARLNTIIKILSQQTAPRELNLLGLFDQYYKYQNHMKIEQCGCKYKYLGKEVNVLQKIQEVKTKYTKYFTQTLSLNLNDRIAYDQTQNSIQFIIGDILRRNYKIFQNCFEYADKYCNHKQHMKVHPVNITTITKSSPPMLKRYRNTAYLWDI